MPFEHGSKAVFKIQNSAGTMTDISNYLTSVSLSREADTAETTSLGNVAKTYIAGLLDATLSVEGIYDPTVDALLSGIWGMRRDFEYYPQGTAAGNVKYTGTCILTSYEPETAVDEAGTFSAEFQVSGAVGRTTV